MGLIARVKGHAFMFEADPLDVRVITSLDLVDNQVLNFGFIEGVLRCCCLLNSWSISTITVFNCGASRSLFLLNIYLI